MPSLKRVDAKRSDAAPSGEALSPPAALVNPFRREDSSAESLFLSGGIEIDQRLNRENHRLNAISIGIPLAGVVCGAALLGALSPTANTFWVFAVFFMLNSLGAGVGLHRYFTHGSFDAHPAVALSLGILGTWAMQGPIARWVSDHRRHHRFTDAQFDPHSPYWNDEGPIPGGIRGWSHAHFLWMLTGRRSSEKRYAKDILSSPIGAFMTRHYWPIAFSGLAAPALVGFALGGAEEALLCFLWAGCARVALLHHLTWSVNSFGHMVGRKQPLSKDESRDSAALALLMLGEGLHSYHHMRPNSAINRPLALDFGGLVIIALERLGLAKNLRRHDR